MLNVSGQTTSANRTAILDRRAGLHWIPLRGLSRNSWFAFLLLPLMALSLSGCGGYSWHQKMTIIVETPDGEVSGSAVTAVKWWRNYIFKDAARWNISATGEAVFVDLGQGRYLFATIVPEHLGSLMLEIEKNVNGRRLLPAVSKLTGKYDLAPELYPRLVTFADIDDPASVKKVEPDNLASEFGPGYSLKSITLEITDEPVTDGTIEPVLKWWREYRYAVEGKYSKRLNGETGAMGQSKEMKNLLGPGNFRLVFDS